MAKSSAGITEGEIREGLLCPICLYDLQTVDQLQEHFEISHSSEDHDVFQALKGFIDKAKRKILKQDTVQGGNDDVSKASFESDTLPLDSPSIPWQKQEVGLTTSHTWYFKKLRDKKMDRYVLETNKLLIRLDKLICDISDDPEKRKEFEKSIVPWVPDADVPLCPGCGKSFGLSRRRHHCRLCGGVMCHSCSYFITYEFARKLTLPMVSDDQHLLPKPSSTPRRPSSANLMSVAGGENLIRICKDCHMLLDRHDKMVEQKHHRPLLVQMYERMKEYMEEVERLVPVYLEMIESLNSGETEYQLDSARELKMKITKLAERIDTHSKKILKLETTDESSCRMQQLQTGIRMAASQFLRNVILGLPSPPTPEEVSRYQSIRLGQVQRRIQLEKQAEMLQNKKESTKSPSPVPVSKPKTMEPISPDTGWCVSSDKVQEEEDPMLQQINIIHKYIQQATLDHKYDEVRMLENNLKELEQEFSK
ncbi:Rabenosyn-5, partial [Stegodyphus mimosarum]